MPTMEIVQLAVEWTIAGAEDGHSYRGEVWSHPAGFDARTLRDGQTVIGVVFRTRAEADRHLELQRAWVADSIRQVTTPRLVRPLAWAPLG